MQVSSRRDWTVLYYLNGNNDLEPNLIKNLLDVEKVGSTDRVDVVAQISRGERNYAAGKRQAERKSGQWKGLRRYHIERHSGRGEVRSPLLVEDKDIPNHGDPKTLRDFLRWGMENFPARHYMVVIGDHGKGFQGAGFDYVHKDTLNLKEFGQALEQSGLKPDVLVMDACEMGAIEVAYQLRERAGFLVASEEIVGQMGLPHQAFLNHLTAHSQLTPLQLAKDLVALSADDSQARLDRGRASSAEQLAALQLSRTGPVVEALEGLAEALRASGESKDYFREQIDETQHFNAENGESPDSDFRDLRHFCQLLQETCADGEVVKASKAVQRALGRLVVANHCVSDEVSDGHGVSIYLPTRAPARRHKAGEFPYRSTEFDQATGWTTWLESLGR